MSRFFTPGAAVFMSFFFMACSDEIKPSVKDTGILINEVAAKGEDWIELYNKTGRSVDLSGYRVYDDPVAIPYTLPSLTLPAGGHVILICDSSATGTGTNFRLSSNGETVYLEDATGALIDFVEFPSLTGSQSWARFPDGGSDWRITGLATQGTANGQAPVATIRNATRTPLVPASGAQVTVTAEVTDALGLTSVKLFRRTNGGVWQSQDMTASAGNLYSAIIPALGANGSVEYYLEVVNKSGQTAYQPASAPDIPYQYLINDDPLPAIRINEYLAVNTTCCADTDGGSAEYDDWIELFNAGDSPVDVGDFYLSDDLLDPFKFRIAATAPQTTTIPPGGYLVIFADEQRSQGILHASFRLAQAGEQLGLFYKDGRTIDQRIFGAQNANQSEGRSPDGGNIWKKMTPTRGTANQ